MDADDVWRTAKVEMPVVILTLVGLFMIISIPLFPVSVSVAMTTVICVVETILHDAVGEPSEGVLPILAVQVSCMMKFVPVTVMVLLM